MPAALVPCVSLLREALRPWIAGCSAVHLVVSFYPGLRQARSPLPKLDPWCANTKQVCPCHVALVDEDWSSQHNDEDAWNVQRFPNLCFDGDAARTAHFVKTAAPLLVPSAGQNVSITVGDAKCSDRRGFWPSSALNCSSNEAVTQTQAQSQPDLVAVQHPQFQFLTISEEMMQTAEHMEARGHPDTLGINRMRRAYELQRFELQRPWSVPDSFCMRWAGTPGARKHACRWSQSILPPFSPREQISFQHSQPAGLWLFWVAWKQLKHAGLPGKGAQVRAFLDDMCRWGRPVVRAPACRGAARESSSGSVGIA